MFAIRRWIDTVKIKSGLFSAPVPDNLLVYAPGTRIQYDPNLIAKLKNDHAQLLDVFDGMMEIAQANDFKKIRGQLNHFLGLFNAHTLLEYTRLYVFLGYAFRDDEEHSVLVREFKADMRIISRDVRAYCTRWTERDIGKYNVRDFIVQSGEIVQVLEQRIRVEEESLYDIYDKASAMFVSNTVSH